MFHEHINFTFENGRHICFANVKKLAAFSQETEIGFKKGKRLSEGVLPSYQGTIFLFF